jgi:hypothetical protein
VRRIAELAEVFVILGRGNLPKGIFKEALENYERKIFPKLKPAVSEALWTVNQEMAFLAPGSLKQKLRDLPIKNIKTRGFKLIEQRGNLEGHISLSRKKDQIITWVDKGTGIYGPHKKPIVPVTKKYLVFDWKGKRWKLGSVKGQKPQRFIKRGIDNATPKIREIIQRAFKQ